MSLIFTLFTFLILGWFACCLLKFHEQNKLRSSKRVYKTTPKPRNVVPVSYTHLDVYKRQVPSGSGGNDTACQVEQGVQISNDGN